jgi:tetratricopeptide (TPR) repeat protein
MFRCWGPMAPGLRALAPRARRRPALTLGLLALWGAGCCSGCSELGARRYAREGNRLYRDGDYSAAIAKYSESERLSGALPVVALNKGLACRQLMIPGAKTSENERALDCALKAFARLKELQPDDRRAEQLYTQTLFDADRFEALAGMYEKQLGEHPQDLSAINALIQVYSRWNRGEKALHWTARRADLQPHNGEAQYAVGVSIFNLLFLKGGGNDKSAYDPRTQPAEQNPPPAFGASDIAGEERLKLADQGIRYLKQALAVRPTYRDAMTYLNLLYRQKSFALFDRPAEWQACIEAAESWRNKVLGMKPPAAASASAR